MIKEMSLDMFGEMFTVFAPQANAEEDIKPANALTEDGARHAGEAAKQLEYAETARASMRAARQTENIGELARISVWHYESCAAAFRRSVLSFESAAKIERAENARRKMLKKARAMAESARQAELAALELTPAENHRKGGSNNETG